MSYCSWRSQEIFRDHWKNGLYACSTCGFELFSSRSKFDHHSPWPSFTETIFQNSLAKEKEFGEGYVGRKAIKVSCGKCGNGLGHEFVGDGPDGKSRF